VYLLREAGRKNPLLELGVFLISGIRKIVFVVSVGGVETLEDIFDIRIDGRAPRRLG
jgi:hypothetical protein